MRCIFLLLGGLFIASCTERPERQECIFKVGDVVEIKTGDKYIVTGTSYFLNRSPCVVNILHSGNKESFFQDTLLVLMEKEGD